MKPWHWCLPIKSIIDVGQGPKGTAYRRVNATFPPIQRSCCGDGVAHTRIVLRITAIINHRPLAQGDMIDYIPQYHLKQTDHYHRKYIPPEQKSSFLHDMPRALTRLACCKAELGAANQDADVDTNRDRRARAKIGRPSCLKHED